MLQQTGHAVVSAICRLADKWHIVSAACACRQGGSIQVMDWLPQGTNGGEVIQFGASRDKQTAADTSQLAGVSTGAATFAFIQARTCSS